MFLPKLTQDRLASANGDPDYIELALLPLLCYLLTLVLNHLYNPISSTFRTFQVPSRREVGTGTRPKEDIPWQRLDPFSPSPSHSYIQLNS